MKYSRYILMVLAFVCSSCAGFLDEKQTTGLSTSGYASEQMLESNILGIIESFSGTWGFTGEPAEFFSISSGLTHWAGSSRLGKPKWDACFDFTQYSTTEVNNWFFEKIYNGITCCNTLIANLPDSPVDEAYKLDIKAEALFYRAVLYFAAVRIWGDLPLRLDRITVESSTNCPRSHFSEVYRQIVEDLEFAQANMRTPQEVQAMGSTVPRPNRYAATAYLSSVYVTIGSLLAHPDDNFWDPGKPGRTPDFTDIGIADSQDAYLKALECAERIIPESDTYDSRCQYRLLYKFSDLFQFTPEFSRDGYTAWNNPEQIFVLTFSPTSSAVSYMADRVLPRYPAGTRQTDPDKSSGNQGRWRPNRWVFQKWCETYPGEQETVKFRGQDVTLYMNSSDPRMDATLYYHTYETCRPEAFPEGYTLYPKVLNVRIESSDDGDKRQWTPYFKKYWSYSFNFDTGDHDFYMMRFAEVYLNAAEAAAAVGNTQKAMDYIGVLHARARRSVADGQQPSAMPDWTGRTFSSQEELLTAIFWERIFELYGEGHEWNETHRHGAQWIVDNICIPKNAFINDRYENRYIVDETDSCIYPKGFRYTTDATQTRKGLLASFPYNETLYNKAISSVEDQNDFFVK